LRNGRLAASDQGISEPHYPFYDKTVAVTNCGRLCLYRKKINLSTCLAGQAVGIKEVDDGIWLVSFMDYDIGYRVAGQRPHKRWVVAASVCVTIEALTRALALELAPIRVHAVSPGVVRTNLWQNMTAAERERLYESVGSSLPVGRVGEAYDIAQAYLFLMKEEFSTGQTLIVDGGTVLV
jgi:hypothetical protein